MTAIIYATRNDYHNAWTDLETVGFNRVGERFTGDLLQERRDIAVLVVPDHATPPEAFLNPTYLFVHNGGPPEQSQRAGFTARPSGFSHGDGPIYDILRTLLNANSGSVDREFVIRELETRIGASQGWVALLDFCMIKEVELLDPRPHDQELEEAKAKIATSEFGRKLLYEDLRRQRPDALESLSDFVARKRAQFAPLA